MFDIKKFLTEHTVSLDKYEAVLLAVMKHVRSDYGKMSVR